MAVSANRLELLQIADAVAREKSIDRMIVIESMQDAIEKAAKTRYGAETEVRAEINPKTGELRLWRLLEVVETVEEPGKQIALKDAQSRNGAAKLGDFVTEPLPPIEFGRIAAQSAKQVIVQKVRDAERERMYDEYINRVGEIVNGTVKRVEYGNVIVDLGRGEAIIRRDELIPREMYRYGDRVRAYIYDVRREQRGPQIFLSRTHPQFMAKLFMQEVPEIYDGIITIRSIARDPGSRAKIAVTTSTTARSIRSAPASVCAARASRRWSANCRAKRSTSSPGPTTSPTSWSRRCSRPMSPRSCSTSRPSASKSWCPTSSSRSPSAAAARTCASPASSSAGTSTSSPSRKSRERRQKEFTERSALVHGGP